MSRQRERDAVLRLLQGNDLEALSRGLGVAAATLSGWRDTFLGRRRGQPGNTSHRGEDLERERLKTRLGEMLLRQGVLEAKIAAAQSGRPLARRRSRLCAAAPRPAVASPTARAIAKFGRGCA
jgi:transposase